MRFQAWHIIVLVVVILIVFGSSRLPQVAESVGKSLKIFKRELKDLREDDGPASGPQPGGGEDAGTGEAKPTGGDQSAER